MTLQSPAYARPRPLLTRRQAADQLALSLRAIDYLLARGELPYLRIGRSVRVCPADVDAYIASHRFGIGLHELVERIEAALAEAGHG